MASRRERLVALLRRRSQPAVSDEERKATDAELAEAARQAGPPRDRAERRPFEERETR